MPAPLRSPSARAAAPGPTLFLAVAARPTAADTAPTAVLHRLQPGTPVRVLGIAGMTEGTFAAVSDAGLVLTAGGTARTIPLDDLRTVWTRGRATRRGGGIGGGIGALTGLVLGIFIAALPNDGDVAHRHPASQLLGGTLVGGLLGAGAGSLLGTAVPDWRRVYPHGPRRAADSDRAPATSASAAAKSLPRLREPWRTPDESPRAGDAVPLRAVGHR